MLHYKMFISKYTSILRASQKGFTLVEITVATSILVILTLLIILRVDGTNAQQEMRLSKNTLLNNIEKMQNFSVAGRICKAGEAPACGSDIVDVGYGVRIVKCLSVPCIHSLYVDVDGDKIYDAGELLGAGAKKLQGSTLLTIIVKDNVGANTAVDSVDVFFNPLTSAIALNSVAVVANIVSAEITLNNKGETLVFTID